MHRLGDLAHIQSPYKTQSYCLHHNQICSSKSIHLKFSSISSMVQKLPSYYQQLVLSQNVLPPAGCVTECSWVHRFLTYCQQHRVTSRWWEENTLLISLACLTMVWKSRPQSLNQQLQSKWRKKKVHTYWSSFKPFVRIDLFSQDLQSILRIRFSIKKDIFSHTLTFMMSLTGVDSKTGMKAFMVGTSTSFLALV